MQLPCISNIGTSSIIPCSLQLDVVVKGSYPKLKKSFSSDMKAHGFYLNILFNISVNPKLEILDLHSKLFLNFQRLF